MSDYQLYTNMADGVIFNWLHVTRNVLLYGYNNSASLGYLALFSLASESTKSLLGFYSLE